MTRIDFYVLPDMRLDARLDFAARLACKAFRAGHRSVFQVEDEAMAEQLDSLLWVEPAQAFLPHARLGTSDASRVPVTIGTAAEIEACEATGRLVHDLLINLGSAIPERFASFDRVAEIISQDEQILAAGRRNYRFYRERGYPIENHDMQGAQRGG